MNIEFMSLNQALENFNFIVAMALFVFAPKLALAALPFLFIAACPISMVAMMFMMNKSKDKDKK